MLADPYPGTTDPLRTVVDWRAAGKRVALATVVATWGSSPCPVGSQLVVEEGGDFLGSVSGGCVEGAVVSAAREVIATGEPRLLDFGVSNERAWEMGLACGGRIQIHLYPVLDASLLATILAARARRVPLALCTALSSGQQRLLALHEEEPPAVQEELTDLARQALARDQSGTFPTTHGTVFIQVYNPPLRMVIVGAVHIAQYLVPMAILAGYDVLVVDPRRAFATAGRFPQVPLVAQWPDAALRELGLDRRTAVVTLTHDPKLDDPALRLALRAPTFYIGALGSRRTQEARLKRLVQEGFTAADLHRIYGPVGLAVGARTPAEIAISILAEITQVLRQEIHS
jgi:xanthine dehydrogenase accessory factor